MVMEQEKGEAEKEKEGEEEAKLNSDRKTAIIVGVLFITATAAGITSAIAYGSNLSKPLDLGEIAENENQMKIGSLFYFIMGLAVAGIGIAIYPILRRYYEGLALGYAGARIIEGVFFIIGVTFMLTLLTLSQEFVDAGAPDDSYYQALGVVIQATGDWAYMLGELVFCVSALILYSILYQTQLVPRWISVWGLIGAIVWPIGSLSLLGSNSGFFFGPIFVNELVLALWLIFKGFNPSAIDSRM
jgi:hypothetical protein